MEIFLKTVDKQDINLLFLWLNKEDSLSGKIISNKPILLNKHQEWFAERLRDKETHMWIIQNDKKKPIGQIRFQKKIENFLDIDIYVSSEARRHGIASKALKLATLQVQNKSLRAIVKKHNRSSYKLFKSSGFSLLSEDIFKWILIKH